MISEEEYTQSFPARMMFGHYSNSGRRVIAGSVWIKDTPGSLAKAVGQVSMAGVNLTESKTQSLPATGIAEWSFFGEATDGHPTLDELRTALEKLPNVVRTFFREGMNGVLVDNWHYPLEFSNGDKAMVFTRATVQGMFQKIDELFGSGGGFLLYELGVTTGESDGNKLVKFLGRERAIAQFQEFLWLYSTNGWGRPELVDFAENPLNVTIKLHDCFECAGTKSANRISNFIRGHQVGLAKELFGKRVEVGELACVAKGDPYCEFRWTEKQQTWSR